MMRVGTPPVIQMSILEKSLDIFRDLDLHKLREESIKLSDLFINMVEQTCSDLHLESPIKSSERGHRCLFSSIWLCDNAGINRQKYSWRF